METPHKNTEISLKEKIKGLNFSVFFGELKNLKEGKGAISFKVLESHYKDQLAVLGLDVEERFRSSGGDTEKQILLNVNNSHIFKNYLDVVDWSKADLVQSADLRGFVETLISETRYEYGSALSENDRFLNFYLTWDKLIEKLYEIPNRRSLELSHDLRNYKNAAVGEYLSEYIVAENMGMLEPFANKMVDSKTPCLANRHKEKDLSAEKYKDFWKKEVFGLLKKIYKKLEADGAELLYKKILNFCLESAKAAKDDLLYISTEEYKDKKTGSSKDKMFEAVMYVVEELEKLKNEFESKR